MPGAVNEAVVPLGVMVPPVAVHVTPVLVAFETVAVSVTEPPAGTVEELGLTETLTAGAGGSVVSPPAASGEGDGKHDEEMVPTAEGSHEGFLEGLSPQGRENRLDPLNRSGTGRRTSILEKHGRYYLLLRRQRHPNDQQTGGIGVARSRSPAGPFLDRLGMPLIDAFHNGALPIDRLVLRDTDGAYGIVYGGWRHCNIARLNDDFTGLRVVSIDALRFDDRGFILPVKITEEGVGADPLTRR